MQKICSTETDAPQLLVWHWKRSGSQHSSRCKLPSWLSWVVCDRHHCWQLCLLIHHCLPLAALLQTHCAGVKVQHRSISLHHLLLKCFQLAHLQPVVLLTVDVIHRVRTPRCTDSLQMHSMS